MEVNTSAHHGEALEALDIELTERCNNDCVHCYINLREDDSNAIRREMPLAMLVRLLSEARDLGCRTIRFTGGEPLVRSDFERIYRRACEFGFDISIATNATLITPRLGRLFLLTPPLSVTVSFYGWDRESYEQTTGKPGSFARFTEGVATLRRNCVLFKPNMPPVPWLLANQASVETFARSLGATGTIPFAWDLSLRARHDPDKSRQIRALRLTPSDAVSLILSDGGRAQLVRQKLQREATRMRKGSRLFTCRAARKRFTVSAYGHLQACLELRHPTVIFDLRDASLADGLAHLVPLIRTMEASSTTYNDRCAKCILRRLCGNCAACSWMETQTLDTPVPYYCSVTHKLARRLGFLSTRENGWSASSLREMAQEDVEAEQGAPPVREPAAGSRR